MSTNYQSIQPKENLVIDVGDEEIDNVLSSLADVVIDDYLNHITTRCYTEIRSTPKHDYEQSNNCHKI